ncbi:MAG: NAD(+) synthase [Gammaproteobacteria bacterium]|nr:NAD(+) synthase [Gammaproteobacteria bacterium]
MSLDDLPRIALVQMQVLPGAPDRNVARMLEHLGEARAARAEVVVFSELCIPGYIVGDLWELDALVADFAAWSETIREASSDLTVIFGNVHLDRARIGEDGRARKYNAVHVVRNGAYVARAGLPADVLPPGLHPKTLHPNYRFFDDDRHFYSLRKLSESTGTTLADWMVPFEIPRAGGGTFRFGVQLCEDMWCQDYCHDGEILDTLRMFHARGASAVFNLSASPWTWQKNDKRNRTVREILSRSGLHYFYVNHVGAQNNGKNILVFDGDTTVYAPDGRVTQRASPWREELVIVGDASAKVSPAQSEEQANLDGIVTGLRHMDAVLARENRFLIGVSGGIDSSLVACLLVEAFGAERVFGVNMPTRFNAEVTRNNARDLCARLGIDYLSCPIEDLYTRLAAAIKDARFAREAGEYSGLVDENLQARIRGADVLAGLAAKHGLLFTNNGNKTEVALGYATLYGDVNGAVAPIADLYKTQVFALARHLNEHVYARETIPANLVEGRTVPSAELSAEQDVTRGLGDPIKYGYHDALLRQMIEYRRHPVDVLRWALDGTLLAALGWSDGERFAAWFADAGAWVEDLEWVARQLGSSYFKRIQAPPIIVLSKRAFGFDLRESQLPAYVPREYATLKREVLARPIAALIGRA